MRGALGKISALVVSTLLCVGLVELLGRAIGFDFDRQLLLLEETPIYYVRPMEPLEPVFFRRPGPAEWSGQVLYTRARKLLGDDARVYADEPSITVRYDANGFRNPPDLADWDIAITGDSFTELGYLPDEELFSSLVGRRLGCRVKNLGVSYSGPFSQTAYLERFGGAPAARDAVLVFFEGNDFGDLVREGDALERFERTGEREYRKIKAQTSFIRAIRDLWRRWHLTEEAFESAELDLGGRVLQITVDYAPPDASELTSRQRDLLDRALGAWQEAARARGMRAWIAFMPCKLRVLYERLTIGPRAPEATRSWKPNGLPDYVRSVAERRGVSFVDLTPALREATARGELAYNPLWDSHLTRAGSRAVAEAIAGALAGGPLDCPERAGAQGAARSLESSRR